MNEVKKQKILSVFNSGENVGIKLYSINNLVDGNINILKDYQPQFPSDVEGIILENRLKHEQF